MERIRFMWRASHYEVGYRCEMSGNITLSVSPDATSHFGTKPKRGTKWRAQANHWNQTTRTLTRYGKDCYSDLQPSAVIAMRLAEKIYMEAIGGVKD